MFGYVGSPTGGREMIPETPQPEIFDVAEDWHLIQVAIGEALRRSVEEVTQEPLPDAVALLLVRLAFAEVIDRVAFDEYQAVLVDADFIARSRAD